MIIVILRLPLLPPLLLPTQEGLQDLEEQVRQLMGGADVDLNGVIDFYVSISDGCRHNFYTGGVILEVVVAGSVEVMGIAVVLFCTVNIASYSPLSS